MGVDAHTGRCVVIADPQHAAAFVDARAVVRRAHRGGGLDQVHAALGGTAGGIHRFLFQGRIHPGQYLVAQAQRAELAAVIALHEGGSQVLDLELRTAGQHRGIAEALQGRGHGLLRASGVQCEGTCGAVDAGAAQAHGAGPLISGVVPQSQLGGQFGIEAKAVGVSRCGGGSRACIQVAGHAVIGGRVQWQRGGLVGRGAIRISRALGRCGPDPRHAVVHAVFIVQVREAEGELVALADTRAVGAGHAGFVDRGARAVVVGHGVHHANAQRAVVVHSAVHISHHAQVVVAGHGGFDAALVDAASHLADLVDRASGGAATKQHRG